ncbi:E3 ubiquitin-protein ligase SH3RF1 isoform X2 [Cimex lectularius]|uniref:RING-type E3 ubiquitin transferase n=1 Tax=Cimex lectularius TaxID=79782 RepID=A0A8I6SA46_CIMLE|nr:E3 ubiquitin-protein ligase SH3RF1 isoform X2 [Cimex lectularius]
MEEWRLLDDLLECSVCLERLDTSSKVLPCQHTFCKKCLEEIFKTQHELRCPECRTLVEIKIDDLPPNVLLVRILEGIRNAPDHSGSSSKKRNQGTRKRETKKTIHDPAQQPLSQQQTQPQTQQATQPPQYHLPCARAIYDYTPKEPGDLTFEKGDFILLKQMLNNNWYHGEANGKVGTFPISYVQVICSLPTQNPNQQQQSQTQPPPHLPCARALYDYSSKEPGDLSFEKGDFIILKQMIDNNWYQGEANGKIGKFPMNYVQVIYSLSPPIPQCKALYDFKMGNDDEEGCLAFNKGDIIKVYRRVDENWAEGALGSRIGIFPLAFVELNALAQIVVKTPKEKGVHLSHYRKVPAQPSEGNSLTPPIPAQQTITANEAMYSSISSYQADTSGLLSVSDSSAANLTSPPITTSSSNSVPTTSTSSSSHSSPISPPHVSNLVAAGPNKRHSFGSSVQNETPGKSKRHSAEILNPPESSQPQSLPPENTGKASNSKVELERQGSQRRNTDHVPSPPPLPPPPPPPPPPIQGLQIHQYPMDLLATYVALYPYKPQKGDELELKRGDRYIVTERCQDGWFKGTSAVSSKSGVFPGNYVAPLGSTHATRPQIPGLYRIAKNSSPSSANNGVPPIERPTICSKLLQGGNQKSLEGGEMTRTSPQVEEQSSTVVPPPNVSVQAVLNKANEKVKEKKEKGVGLMRRLASMKKSKSPPPTPYSMDNPVFEDSSMLLSQPIHIRSGSCPNQLLGTNSTSDSPAINYPRILSQSNRSKHIERPSISRISPRTFTNESSVSVQHRKSHSMDTNSSTSHDVSPQIPNQYFKPLLTNDVPSTSTSQCAPSALQNKLPPGAPDLKPRKVLSSVENPTSIPVPPAGDNPLPECHTQDDKRKSDIQLIKIEDAKSADNKHPKVYELLSQVMSHSFPVPSPRKVPEKTSQLKPQPSDSSGKNYARQCAIAKRILSNTWNSHERMPSPPKTLPKERVRCIVPYPPNSEFELELELGDVIYVHKKREDGWYKGTQERTGRTGLFPASFVQSF